MVFLELTHRDLTLYVCDLLLLNCIGPKLKLCNRIFLEAKHPI